MEEIFLILFVKYYIKIKKTLKQQSIYLSVVLLLLTQSYSIAASSSLPNKSYQIIAGFLLQFTSFVEWPSGTKDGVNLCLVGGDPFGNFIDEMVKSRPTNRKGQAIIVRRLLLGSSVEFCHIIFSTEQSTNELFWRALPKNHSILLVSETSDFTKNGGFVSVYRENKRIRLDVNLELVNRARLKMSSQLLKLAKITKSNQGVDK